jgi:hypothetical protein
MNAQVLKRRNQMEPTISNKTTSTVHLRSWLFNPFKYVAGFHALLLGVGVILVSALLAWPGKTHFDGVLDFHIGFESPAWVFFAEGILNWICLAVPLYFFGLIIAKSAPRIIDVFGTQALARGPYLIAAIVMLPEANRRFSAELLRAAAKGGLVFQDVSYADMSIFIFCSMAGLVMLVWMVVLMYRAYAVSCNLRGSKTVVTFIISLIGAEIMVKMVLVLLLS